MMFKPWFWILVAVLIFPVTQATLLLCDQGYCGWPAKARCRICDERIWLWQRHNERIYDTIIDVPRSQADPKYLDFDLHIGGLCHECWVGNPLVRFRVNIQRKDSYTTVEFEGLELRPQETIQGQIQIRRDVKIGPTEDDDTDKTLI